MHGYGSWIRWTQEKDTLLTLVAVAPLILGPTHEKCHDKWVKSFDIASREEFGKGKWTSIEDVLLTEVVKKHGCFGSGSNEYAAGAFSRRTAA
jgi:hypothetical protein